MTDDTKTCPDCAESIKAAAVRCRYCGASFDGARQVAVVHTAPQTSSLVRVIFLVLLLVFVFALLGGFSSLA